MVDFEQFSANLVAKHRDLFWQVSKDILPNSFFAILDGWLAQRNMNAVRGMIVSATVMGVVTFVLIVLGTFCSDWFIIIAYIFEFAICKSITLFHANDLFV